MATIFRPPLGTRIIPAVGAQQPDYVPNLLVRELLSADAFFGLAGHPNFDFPNPRGPLWTDTHRAGFCRGVTLALLGQDQFFTGAGCAPDYDWPNPTLRVSPWQAINSQAPLNLLETTLAKPVGHLEDQPNPRGPTWTNDVRGGFAQPVPLNLLSQDKFFGLAGHPTFDFPNPLRPRWASDLLTGMVAGVNPCLIGQDKFFGVAGSPLEDFPNPRGPTWTDTLRAGFTQAAPLTLLSKDAFFGLAGKPNFDQPNPTLRASSFAALAAQPVPNLALTTLAIPPGTPTALYDWPNPRGAVFSSDVRNGFTAAVPLNLLGKDAFFGAPGQSPVYDYPNPQVKRPAPNLDYFANLLETVLAHPVGAAAPVPDARARVAQQPDVAPNLLGTTLAVPVGAAAPWSNPERLRSVPFEQVPNLLGTLLATPSAPVGASVLGPNPAAIRARPLDQTPPNILLTTLALPNVKPFAQNEWPNPVLRLLSGDRWAVLFASPLALLAHTLVPVAGRIGVTLPVRLRLDFDLSAATRVSLTLPVCRRKEF